MGIPTYIGDCDATLIEEVPQLDYRGVDRLVQVWEMKHADARAFIQARRQDQIPISSDLYSVAEIANVFYKSASVQSGGSPFSTVTLNYEGFLAARDIDQGYVDRQDAIVVAQNTVPTDADASVSISYYTQQTTYRWFSSSQPFGPRFPTTVPSTVSVNQIFSYSPARFDGDIQIKYVGRLAEFTRTEIAPGKWAVSETWIRRIEEDPDA